MPEENNRIWCIYCQWWVDRADLIFWTGDDAAHFLCPGCDADMIYPILAYDDWFRLQIKKYEAGEEKHD